MARYYFDDQGKRQIEGVIRRVGQIPPESSVGAGSRREGDPFRAVKLSEELEKDGEAKAVPLYWSGTEWVESSESITVRDLMLKEDETIASGLRCVVAWFGAWAVIAAECGE